MADQFVILKRKTSGGFDVLLPETDILQVRGLSSELATIYNEIEAGGASFHTCTTSKYTPEKAITTTDEYITNKLYAFQFGEGNLEPNVTIKFSSEANAHPVKFQGAAVTAAAFTLEALAIVLTIFDGAAFHLIGSQGFVDESTWA